MLVIRLIKNPFFIGNQILWGMTANINCPKECLYQQKLQTNTGSMHVISQLLDILLDMFGGATSVWHKSYYCKTNRLTWNCWNFSPSAVNCNRKFFSVASNCDTWSAYIFIWDCSCFNFSSCCLVFKSASWSSRFFCFNCKEKDIHQTFIQKEKTLTSAKMFYNLNNTRRF